MLTMNGVKTSSVNCNIHVIFLTYAVNNFVMKRLLLPLISDTALCVFICFFASFTCMRYYTRNIVISLICALLCSALVGIISFLCIRGKLKKNYLLKSDEKRRALLATHLALADWQYIRDSFLTILPDAEISTNDTLLRFGERHFFLFKISALRPDDIGDIIKTPCGQKKIVHCNYIESEARAIAESYGIEVKDIKDAYISFNQANIMPQKFTYSPYEKLSFFKSIKGAFKRSLYKKLFFYGMGFLALSYFTFFPLYYVVLGGSMLFLSLLCLLFGRRD